PSPSAPRPSPGRASCRSLRHRLHGLEDVPVAGAAADVALQRLLDLVLGRARVLTQQRGRGYQHPRRAVAALESVMLVEGLLQRRQLLALAEPLDGLDARAVRLDGEEHAALDERAVEDHRAGAAVAGVATDVAAGEVEVVAEEMDEELARLDVALVRRPVDGDRDVHQRAAASSAARVASTSERWIRYSLEAWTSDGGMRFAARTASATASGPSDVRSTGTASTQASATRTPPFTEGAALQMKGAS